MNRLAKKKVLILYTGGTIGMVPSGQGLVSSSNFEERFLTLLTEHQISQLPAWYFCEITPLIDSANMDQQHWWSIFEAIKYQAAQDVYDSILILQGTDTLAYTASVLSFFLLDSNIPIILTGSMHPIGSANSDALLNLLGAMECIVHKELDPSVYVFFNHRLMHGNRVSKLHSDTIDAFVELDKRREIISKPSSFARVRLIKKTIDIAVLPLFPGISVKHIQAIIASRPQALVLELYGSGTGPSNNLALLDMLKDAHDEQKIVLVAMSQCIQGFLDFSTYAAGKPFEGVGCISAGGMTREAVISKLFFLFSAGFNQEMTEYWFLQDLCGERANYKNQ